MKKNINVCFVGNLSSAFVKRDYKILKKHFDVDVVEIPKKKLGWIKYAFILAKTVKKSDLVFSWFASWHSALGVFFSKFFKKTSVVVAGGYDAVFCPEINYGAFTNLKEKIPAYYVLNHADLLLAVSQFNLNEVLRVAKPKKIKMVYNGVDTTKFKPSNYKEKNLIITVGAINWNNLKRKGIETFVRTAKYLQECCFVVIGKYIDNSIDYLKSIASENVVFTGFVSESELIKWYQKANVICQLSYHEAFGHAPAEGMACGCIPVITKEINAMSEIIGNAGFYVSFGDEKETAEAIKKALNASDEARKKARERIIEMFSMEEREIKLTTIIENMVGLK
ncbi:MAG: glycosyltransferase [Thermoplasmatota archaeon]|jgi:glycosyltransferase involved in cell wall biosynthesis